MESIEERIKREIHRAGGKISPKVLMARFGKGRRDAQRIVQSGLDRGTFVLESDMKIALKEH